MSKKGKTTDSRVDIASVRSVYVIVIVVFVLAFVGGGYTLGLLVDSEAAGTANEDPNILEAANDPAAYDFGNVDDGGDGTANEPTATPPEDDDDEDDESMGNNGPG